ncbi:hypothetical protein MPSEU_000941300 [Mayamaea pseudoterrestris]|nr:hypothetical protein MPSEU_000941300 [Mayamaea pseudoterrestris]
MNNHCSAHEIPNVPNVFIDAFRGQYLNKTADPQSTFILTHYHGDHYGSLPRDESYVGPALIHCTPITARLLKKIHKVPEAFVVEHEYGETWTTAATLLDNPSSAPVKITFYDANHCPGAAIVIFELANESVHVHTGDFRYHERMQTYSRLRQAALANRIESILLDTTYAHPKHTFDAQDIVVESIAAHVKQHLDGETLILLECYNIGKEKILWATVNACQQSIHVSERKWNLLECLTDGSSEDDFRDEHKHCQVIRMCTRDPTQTDIHIVPMSTSGEMWPFFQPNYEKIAKYVEHQTHKTYSKVVSFVPTGWAEATNWNKKHASTKMVRRGLNIQIHLVAYSEHSSYSELQELVKFTKPMRVVATVYKDEHDKRNIEKRFQVDRTRAKKRFLEQMSARPLQRKAPSSSETLTNLDRDSLMLSSPVAKHCQVIVIDDETKCSIPDDSCDDGKLVQLVAMGFSIEESRRALVSTRQEIEAAINILLQKAPTIRTAMSPPFTKAKNSSPNSEPSSSKSFASTQPSKLTAYFKKREK